MNGQPRKRHSHTLKKQHQKKGWKRSMRFQPCCMNALSNKKRLIPRHSCGVSGALASLQQQEYPASHLQVLGR